MYFCAGWFGPVGVATHAVDGRRPAAEHHQHLALGAELGDHVGALVDRPDIVLRIDAHRMGELEAVIALADFLEEVAVLIELEQPRVGAAVIDEDMALRVGRDGDGFAEILARRQLQEIRHRGVGNLRHVLRLGLLLGQGGSGTQHQGGGRQVRETAFHGVLPKNCDEFAHLAVAPIEIYANSPAASTETRPDDAKSLGSAGHAGTRRVGGSITRYSMCLSWLSR